MLPGIPLLCGVIVCVRPWEIILPGGTIDEFIVCDRPGGAAPKMLENAASRAFVDPYPSGRGP